MEEKDTLYARMLSGDLSPSEIAALKASNEWAEIEQIIAVTDQLNLPPYDKEAAFRQLEARKVKQKTAKVRFLNSKRWLGLAASFLLLVTLFFLFRNQPNIIEAKLATATLNHQFSDQSTVQLNDGSSIEYMEKNWAKERLVKLKGEALFQVEKGSPFIVSTTMGRVEVLGTSFNVRSWDDQLSVVCYSGKVKVSAGTETVFLEKGQAVQYANQQMGQLQVINETQPAWTEARSKFEAEDIHAVFEELARQYDVKIEVPKLNKQFSGSFTHDSLERALNEICKPMGLKSKMDATQKNITISE
jgi:ferric-dicitrate binding protein FerR (iron transport regulator)